MSFIGGTTNKVRIGSIQEAWYTEILVAVITTVGVPVEETLAGIGIKSRKVLIYMECGVEASWVSSLG